MLWNWWFYTTILALFLSGSSSGEHLHGWHSSDFTWWCRDGAGTSHQTHAGVCVWHVLCVHAYMCMCVYLCTHMCVHVHMHMCVLVFISLCVGCQNVCLIALCYIKWTNNSSCLWTLSIFFFLASILPMENSTTKPFLSGMTPQVALGHSHTCTFSYQTAKNRNKEKYFWCRFHYQVLHFSTLGFCERVGKALAVEIFKKNRKGSKWSISVRSNRFSLMKILNIPFELWQYLKW